ncbi:hypothetical protein D9757_005416 [Collybiopsis confluens]|uniref:Phosphoglycerate mutase n=1 Tax=Collybiopsis confluens TaxID=2823264 RepID=A0A8H5HKY7_9AGAR|nr:hypothetical protein D9757_005416 [Collybiopsis confluens]
MRARLINFKNWDILDPPLTPLGRHQSEELLSQTADLQQSADLLVSSPLKRTLQTTIIGYRTLKARLENQNPPKPLAVMSRLQEVNAFPCDTGCSRRELEQVEEFRGINFEALEDDWNSKQGEFGTDPKTVAQRARWVRQWLRNRPEQNIVVVSHGDFLREIIKSFYEPWANAQLRQFIFAHADDDEAELIEFSAASQACAGEMEPTSSASEMLTKA